MRTHFRDLFLTLSVGGRAYEGSKRLLIRSRMEITLMNDEDLRSRYHNVYYRYIDYDYRKLPHYGLLVISSSDKICVSNDNKYSSTYLNFLSVD